MAKEYREKFNEFDKSLKASRQTYNKHEKEVAQMNKQIKDLEEQKKRVLLHTVGVEVSKKKKKGKGGLEFENEALEKALDIQSKHEEEMNKLKLGWETERKELNETKDQIAARCKAL